MPTFIAYVGLVAQLNYCHCINFVRASDVYSPRVRTEKHHTSKPKQKKRTSATEFDVVGNNQPRELRGEPNRRSSSIQVLTSETSRAFATRALHIATGERSWIRPMYHTKYCAVDTLLRDTNPIVEGGGKLVGHLQIWSRRDTRWPSEEVQEWIVHRAYGLGQYIPREILRSCVEHPCVPNGSYSLTLELRTEEQETQQPDRYRRHTQC